MSIINPENFPYPETNKEVAEIATTYDKMESALDAGNVSYLKVFDVTTSTFQFFVETDVSSKILVLEYGIHSFNRMYVTNSCENEFYNMIGSVLLAALTAQQFDLVTRHHGENVFPVSRFEERKGVRE